ncbi:MAG: hypothetical protein EAZ20_10335 [Bacteroidetes bacterium]|nr:MAG: hypothetical protein EAZ20_10335 [Bacteroidota bacterium]
MKNTTESSTENTNQNNVSPNKFKLEWIVSFFSLFISISSFIFIGIQTSIMQSQQKASVWAYLEVVRNISGDGFYIEVQNKGVGPAIIKKVSYIYENKIYDDFSKMAKQIIVDKDFNYNIYSTNPINEKVMSANEKIRIFAVKNMKYAEKLIFSNFQCQITYENIYGDKTLFDTKTQKD